MFEVYQNQGFEHNPADYTILGLEFIGTCGSFPEQYDVVWTDNGDSTRQGSGSEVRYQVGYVRLRGGYFAVYFHDVTSEVIPAPIFSHVFEVGNRGSFDDEETRLAYLGVAAKVIKYALDDLTQGGS